MSFVDLQTFKSNPNGFSPDQEIDTQARHNLTWGNRLIDRGRADQQFFQEIRTIYQERLGIQNESVFQRAWGQARRAGLIQWSSHLPLTVENFQQIEQALRATLIYQGRGMGPARPAEGDQPISYSAIGALLQNLLGNQVLTSESLGFSHFRGIFIQKDPELLRAFRQELRQVFAACAERTAPQTPAESLLMQIFIGHLVALLPYTYPEVGEEFPIRLQVNGQWQTFSYRVDRAIEITPRLFSTPIMAYGLVAPGAPPLLTFLGTTFPAGDGFVATVLSDFTPGFSVGHVAAWLGKERVRDWLQDKQGVQLYGTSLGGALTFHTLRYHKEHIGQVHAYNPPGLYPWNWTETYDQPSLQINIYYQENDVVPTMGFFPEGEQVKVYRLHAGKPVRGFRAHAVVYTGMEDVSILKSSAPYENSRLIRKFLTVLHFLIGGVVLFLPILACYLLFLLLRSLSLPLFLIKK